MGAQRLQFTLVLLVASCASSSSNPSTPDGDVDDDVADAVSRLPGAEIESSRDGVPTFVSGDLGRASNGKLDAGKADSALGDILRDVGPVFRLSPTQLKLLSVSADGDGAVHARYRQLQYGLDVEGADLLVHVDPRGVVYAANGTARGGTTPSMLTSVEPDEAVTSLLSGRYRGMTAGPARLAFVQDDARAPRLAWAVVVSGEREGEPIEDEVFVDAHTGAVAATHPRVHSARNRLITTVSNGQILPGTDVIAEGGPSPRDSHAGELYDHLGASYDCYKALFSRDSYDDKGGKLIGVAHYGVNTQNAYWRGNGYLVFGDGDGKESGPFGRAYDVVAHELTHGVTGNTAKLVYENESGAINEAMSDIFGAVCESWRAGRVDANTWKIGEDMETPGVPGDALRYMDDPVADKISRDFYADRYAGTWDNGGVHVNSGIGNLAFKLLVTGGRHPRGKSTVTVPALGMDKARAIFYRTLTTYLTSTSEYAELRSAATFAANELYGASARDAVAAAFTAVGVDPALAAALPVTLLNSGTDKLLADKKYGQKVFAIDVPAGTGLLVAELSGGTGDADLYLKAGAAPTTYRHDLSSTNLSSSREVVSLTAPAAGRVYVLVAAAADYSNVTLTARVSQNLPTIALDGGQWQTVSGKKGNARLFSIDVPADAVAVTFELEGAAGDGDLYVRRGQAPSPLTFDAKSATAGTSRELITLEPSGGSYLALIHGAGDFTEATVRATVFTARRIGAGDTVELAGAAGTPALFVLDVPADQALEVALTGGDGDADVYVQMGSPPTDKHHELGSFGPTNDELVVATGLVPGPAFIAVAGNGPYKGVKLTARLLADLGVHTLANKRDVNVGLPAGGEARFTLEVPPTAIDGTFALSGGDAELFVKRGGTATPTSFDWTGKKIEIAPLFGSSYSVLVRARKDGASWLNATYQATPDLAAGKPVFLSGIAGSKKVFKIDASAAGSRGVSVVLQGGDGDADLYVKKGAVPTAGEGGADGASEGPANEESVVLDDGPGVYWVVVLGASEHSLAELEGSVRK